MIRLNLLIVLLVSLAASPAAAEIWDPSNSILTIDPAAEGASVLVLPDGNGLSFVEAYGPFGIIVDATITLAIFDNNGLPIVSFPAEDVWLETSEGGLSPCLGGTTADRDTDENGETIWREPLQAGGCSVGEVTYAYVLGQRIPGPGLPLVFRSPDLGGDLVVNLTDVVEFTQSLNDGTGSCADFNNDGNVNLSDIVRMVHGIGAQCP